jgi:glycerophosphoryl diester phosphodiesterase
MYKKGRVYMKGFVLILFFLSFVCRADFVVTSHKTAGLEFPENSMPGFIHSLKLPVQAVEIDLHVTADQKIVLAHDPVFDNQNCFEKKSTKKLVIATTNLDELLKLKCRNYKVPDKKNKKDYTIYTIPTFEEVLDEFIKSGRSDIELNIEIKVWDELIQNAPRYKGLDKSTFHYPHQEVADLVYDVVRSKNLASNILWTTFSRELLLIMKNDMQANEEFRFGLLFKGDYSPWKLAWATWTRFKRCYDNCWWPNWKEAREWMIDNEIDVFIPNWPQIDNFLFRNGFKKYFVNHNRPFEVYPWTLNTEATWETMKTMYVDGVITDRPTKFLEWMNKQ